MVLLLRIGGLVVALLTYRWLPATLDSLFDVYALSEPSVPYVGLLETMRDPGCVRSTIPALAIALASTGFVALLVEAVKALQYLQPRSDPLYLYLLLLSYQVSLPIELLRLFDQGSQSF